MRAAGARGFTLIELMAGIAVLAVLLSIGVPSFRDLLAASRLTTLSNNMVTAIASARGEARKRGIPVTFCAANDGVTGCRTDGSWNREWIVFTDDAGGAGMIDTGDELLDRFPVPPSGYGVTAISPTNLNYIRFMRNGAPDTTASPIRALKLTRPSCTGNNARQITVSNTGRATSAKVAC